MIFFKNYKNILNLFLITTIMNFNNIFFFTSDYMLAYFIYNDKQFNYFIFKLILPSFTFGIFLSGFHIVYIIDIFGYKKIIQLTFNSWLLKQDLTREGTVFHFLR